jgi:hypothetical protein
MQQIDSMKHSSGWLAHRSGDRGHGPRARRARRPTAVQCVVVAPRHRSVAPCRRTRRTHSKGRSTAARGMASFGVSSGRLRRSCRQRVADLRHGGRGGIADDMLADPGGDRFGHSRWRVRSSVTLCRQRRRRRRVRPPRTRRPCAPSGSPRRVFGGSHAWGQVPTPRMTQRDV